MSLGLIDCQALAEMCCQLERCANFETLDVSVRKLTC